jgi:hypothetical protein
MGPTDRWPNGYGFDYFYGFLAGETSQWEPRLVENDAFVEPPHDDPKYHLTEDMVAKSLAWLDQRQSFAPDKPFFMYWAPGAAHGPHHIEIDVEVTDGSSGVLYALGGSSGGVTLYMDQGHLVYLYNMMIIEQYAARSAAPLAAGRHRIEVVTDIAGPGKAGTATLFVDGREVGRADLKRTVPAAFTASESFDVGIDLGAPVAMQYSARRPFAFDGEIRTLKVEMKGR